MMAKILFCGIMQQMQITFLYLTCCKKCDVAVLQWWNFIQSRNILEDAPKKKGGGAQVKLCKAQQAATLVGSLKSPIQPSSLKCLPVCCHIQEENICLINYVRIILKLNYDEFISDRAGSVFVVLSRREELCCKLQTCSVSVRLKVRLD